MTTRIKKQVIEKTKTYRENGERYRITARIRHDDRCGNGHNTFSITGDIDVWYRDHWREYSGGCIHDDIAKHFPEFAPYIKWHLVSTDGPMHYIANTTYHAKRIDKHQGQQFVYLGNKQLGVKPTLLGIFSDAELAELKKRYPPSDLSTKEHFNALAKEPDIDAARRCAIWPDATLEQLRDEKALCARLPELLDEFRADVESLGLVY